MSALHTGHVTGMDDGRTLLHTDVSGFLAALGFELATFRSVDLKQENGERVNPPFFML